VAALDVLIADVASRMPNILPVLRAVRAGALGYVEILGDRSRVLRQRQGLPMVILVPDVQARGPSGFPRSWFGRWSSGRAPC